EGRPPERVIAQARVERLETRRKRLERILKNTTIDEKDRLAVAGRFYRLLSRQKYKLEPWRDLLRGKEGGARIWGKFDELTGGACPVQREMLEFLGGWLIRQLELDREPADLARSNRKGVSMCDLADALLSDYARRTGVNWSARTVLGLDPFLAMDTDIIRVRF